MVRTILQNTHQLNPHNPDDEEKILRFIYGTSGPFDESIEGINDSISLTDLSSALATAPIHIPNEPDELYSELLDTVRNLGLDFTESCVVHDFRRQSNKDDAEIREEQLGDTLGGRGDQLGEVDEIGDGTKAFPFGWPDKASIPLNEYTAPGYMTLAFPSLFPLGYGSYSDDREHKLKFEEWAMHLMHYYDRRFAAHPSFPFFMLNTHERNLANAQTRLFIRGERTLHKDTTIGELRAVHSAQRQTMFKKLQSFGCTLRNTDAFFAERRKELHAMIEQVGDPTTFATHADHHCPSILTFMCILEWAYHCND